MGLFEELGMKRTWRIRMFSRYYWLKIRIDSKAHRIKMGLEQRFPRLMNEGEATARVVNLAFDGFPMDGDFASKEDAVVLLQGIWDIVDNWDGSRVNVRWAQGHDLPEGGVLAWARRRPLDDAIANAIRDGRRMVAEIEGTNYVAHECPVCGHVHLPRDENEPVTGQGTNRAGA